MRYSTVAYCAIGVMFCLYRKFAHGTRGKLSSIVDAKGLSENSGPRIAVMILNFNQLNYLRSCLASIPKPIPRNVSICVIDNGSTDGSPRFVRRRYPGIKLITFTSNLGFAEAYNRAIAQVEADCILLLNNDTVILSSSWIRLLSRHLEGDTATVTCWL